VSATPDLAAGGWLWRPLIGATLLQVAVSATRPTTSYAALAMGADGFTIGLLAAAYAVPSMLAAIHIGRLAAHWNRIGTLPVLAALATALGCALSAMAADLVTLAIGTGLVGLGNIGVLIGAQTWISRATITKNYDQGFGWMTAGMSGGQAVGPLFAGVLIETNARVFEGTGMSFWFASAICITVAVCFLSPRRVPQSSDSGAAARKSSVQLLRRPGVLRIIFVSAAVLTSVDILGAYLPLLGEQVGIAPSIIGLLLAARGFSSMASRILLPALVARIERSQLVVISSIGSAVTLLMLALFPWPPLMLAALIVGGFMLGVGQPLTMTAVALAVARHDRPRVLALRLLGNRIAQTATPLVAGTAAAVFGVASVFWLQATMLVTAAAWVGITSRPGTGED
jgi:predicted MFS family arabinose efflux permease